MIAVVRGAAAILQQETLETAIVRIPHGRVDADVSRDAGENQVLDSVPAEHQLEIGGVERALAGLVDDRLAGDGSHFGNDFPARLAANEDAATWSLVTDAGAHALRAPALVGRQVGQVGPVAFTGVNDGELLPAHDGE